MDEAKIDRINELAWKQRTEGLTEAETVERQQLREEYVASVRENLESHLKNIQVEDENGEPRPLTRRP